jgi:hypothetical protein
VLVLVDSSGSMAERTRDGQIKLDAARAALARIQPQLHGHATGLMLFGHRLSAKADGSCQDIELVVPLATEADARVLAGLQRLRALGRTPLAGTLMAAKDVLLGHRRDAPKIVLLITDGNETCGGDPVAAAAALRRAGIDVQLHVVGFALAAGEDRQLREVAAAGGGTYIDARDAESLGQVLPQVLRDAIVRTEARTVGSTVLLDDGFDGTALAPTWQVLSPDPDRLAVAEGAAYIVTRHEPGGMATVGNRLVARDVLSAADADIEVAFDFRLRQQGQTAGLMLYQDDENHVTLTAVALEWGYNIQRAVRLARVIGGQVTESHIRLGFNADKEPVRYELRLQKRGLRVFGHLKQTDEKTGEVRWTEVGRTALPTLVEPRVGLLAHNALAEHYGAGKVAETDAAFDRLRVTALTIERTRTAEAVENAAFRTTFDAPAVFEEDFEILHADRTRLGVERGLHVVTQEGWYGNEAKPVRNLVLARRALPAGDVRIEVQASGRLTSQGGHFGVVLYQDDDNWLELVHDTRTEGGHGLNPNIRLVRRTRGEVSSVVRDIQLDGSDEAELFLLRLERQGVRVLASANVWNPKTRQREWIDIGAQTLVRFNGRLGLAAYTPPKTTHEGWSHAMPIRFDALTVSGR